MSLTFEWDEDKAGTNLKKHGVSFEEASTVLDDPLSLTITDPLHSDEEERFVTIGRSVKQRTLVVVHTDRGETSRLISARVANKSEKAAYEKGS